MLSRREQVRVLIVVSTSWNSPNVVTIDDAHPYGLVTIDVAGFDGRAVKNRAEECLSLESEIGVCGPVESAHVTPHDILATCLMRDRPTMAEVP